MIYTDNSKVIDALQRRIADLEDEIHEKDLDYKHLKNKLFKVLLGDENETLDERIAELEAILIDTYNSFTVDMGRIQEAIPELKEQNNES